MTQLSELFRGLGLQKKVDAPLGPDRARQAQLSPPAQGHHVPIAAGDRFIVGPMLQSPVQIRFRVFMGAADLGAVRQASQPLHRPVHVRRRSFHQSSATR